MPAHPSPTRWEPCGLCKSITDPQHLTPISEVIPGRKRGWVCDYCRARREGLMRLPHRADR